MKKLSDEEFLLFSLKNKILHDTASGDHEIDGDHHRREFKKGENMPHYTTIMRVGEAHRYQVRIYMAITGNSLAFYLYAHELNESLFYHNENYYLTFGASTFCVSLSPYSKNCIGFMFNEQ